MTAAARKKREAPTREQLRDIDSHALGARSGIVNVNIVKRTRQHLEGFIYYVVYFPAVLIAMLCVFIFIDVVEQHVFYVDD